MPNKVRKPLKAKIIASENSQSVAQMGSLTISSLVIPKTQPYLKDRCIPFIRLTRRWLKEAGFKIDSRVDIIVNNQLLIIKPVNVQ
ncbi:MAG: type I toxin-antitoxin system SymE family toxin [Tannerellaceae bacterium]|nr:type I toxin-antitoxin system SymE family toxin [Tannerellaceae bacterium]